jgi:hypothetical protein
LVRLTSGVQGLAQQSGILVRGGAPCFYDVRDVRADTKQGYMVTNEPPRGSGSPTSARPEAAPSHLSVERRAHILDNEIRPKL